MRDVLEAGGADRFTEEELRELVLLTRTIRSGMSCDLSHGDPCRGDRLALLPFMARYLRLHGYTVKEKR